MTTLGNGLHDAGHHEEALSVKEAELSLIRRVGGPEENKLAVKNNLANSYHKLGRSEQALEMYRDVYYGFAKLKGEEDTDTLLVAENYADSLVQLDAHPITRTP